MRILEGETMKNEDTVRNHWGGRWVVVLAMLALIAVPAAAQKVYVDYDRAVDFGQFRTFAWAQTSETSMADSSPLMHSRVKNNIEAQLADAGMIEDAENPDVYVTYHTDEKQEMRLNTTHFGYGYGGGWGWDPYWDWGPSMTSSTTHAYPYVRGTLVVDIWDAKAKELIWRGSAEGVVKEKPEAAARQIEKVLKKMGKKWARMYGK